MVISRRVRMTEVVYGSAVRVAAHGPSGPPIARCGNGRSTVGPGHLAEEAMETRDGHQKGPQQHAEGQHGEKAHSRFLEQIHQPMRRDEDEPPEHDGESESSGDDRQRR
jgi:hypothetical protein